MAIQYHIYANDGAGGPVDYSAPIGTTAATTFTIDPAPAAGSDTTYAVRAFDDVSGLEEKNTDARVRFVRAGDGSDATGRPDSPSLVQAAPIAGAGLRVSWAYPAVGRAVAPAGFHAWVAVSAIDYGAAPAATVNYSDGKTSYFVDIPGLIDGQVYNVAVRAYNASGDDGNTDVATATADGTGPGAVIGLAGSII